MNLKNFQFNKICHFANHPYLCKGIMLAVLFFSSNLYAITLEQGLEENFKLERNNTNAKRLKEIIQPLHNLKPSPTITTKFEKEEQCIVVRTIDVQGVSLISSEEINAITQTFTNKCLGRVNINNIIKSLNKLYFNHGFITTRIYLPKQKQNEGILKLVAIEGRINKLSSNDKNLYLDNLFAYKQKDYLNMRDLEQGTDQINRMESYQSKADIQPTDEIGYSDVIIKSSHKKNVHFRMGVNNSGSESTGKTLVSTGSSINNLAGISDQLTIDLKFNSDADESKKLNRSIALSYDVPYLDWNFGARLNQTKNVSIVDGAVLPFQLKNTNRDTGLYIKKNIYRDESKKVLLDVSWNKKHKVSLLNENKVDKSSYTKEHLEIGINLSEKTQNNSTYSIDLKIKQGLGVKAVFHNVLKQIIPRPEGSPNKYFTLYKLGGSYNSTLFNNKVSLKLEFDAQYSNDILFGGEMFQIGGSSSVRGYSNNSIIGRKGMYLRSTFSFTELAKHIPLNPTFYILYDTGRVFQDSSSAGGSLEGKGIGVKFNLFKQKLSFEYAKNHSRKHDTSFDASLNASF